MKRKTASKIIAAILVSVICVTLFSLAASAIPLETKGSITLHVADYDTGEPIDSLTFRIYFFASAYEKGEGLGYGYVIPYDDCNMEIDNLEDSYLPIHLAHYAETHSLPYSENTTDKEGNAVFTDLSAGLYLAVFTDSGNDYFVPAPFVINIPHFDEENKNWKFDIIAKPKMLSYTWADTESDTYISVKKIWETDGDIPEGVSVSLLCDYKEVATVTLCEDNNWSYRWEKLSKKHSWSVVEGKVPDGFTVSYEVSENTVKIINTAVTEETTTTPTTDESTTAPSSTEPDDTTEPSSTEPQETTAPTTTSPTTTAPEGTTKPTTTAPEETTKPEELIDTGQLNWPVPVFSIAGMLLFSAGWVLYNSAKREEEEAV